MAKIKLLLVSFFIFNAAFLFSSPGKLHLKNGNIIEGDIKIEKNGACWVTAGNGIIKFEKNEIKRIESKRKDYLKEKSNISLNIKRKAKKDDVYNNEIYAAAKKHNMDPALIKAVVKAESGFNEKDRSCKGAMGLMQLMPETAGMLGVRDICDPEQNVNAGTRFLKNMLYKFDGDLELALAAYNAGPGAVIKYGCKVPPYKETVNYIRKVYRYYQDYNKPDKIYTFTDEKGCINIYNIKK